MKCAKCGGDMMLHGESETLVAYISPLGHNHDDNCVSQKYLCECGHAETVSIRNRCNACNWVGQSECFCHPGKKVDEWPE